MSWTSWAAIAAAIASPAAARIEVPPDCSLVERAADGREIVTPAHPGSTKSHGGHASASASSHGRASSSVSVQASSRNGQSSASSVSKSSDGRRTITTIRDETGCRVIVDDAGPGDTP